MRPKLPIWNIRNETLLLTSMKNFVLSMSLKLSYENETLSLCVYHLGCTYMHFVKPCMSIPVIEINKI